MIGDDGKALSEDHIVYKKFKERLAFYQLIFVENDIKIDINYKDGLVQGTIEKPELIKLIKLEKRIVEEYNIQTGIYQFVAGLIGIGKNECL